MSIESITTGSVCKLLPVAQARNLDDSLSHLDNNIITCKGASSSLHVGNIDYSILVEYKNFLGRDEAFFNATNIINQYNLKVSLGACSRKKKLNNWLRNNDTKEIIKKLQSVYALKGSKKLIEQKGTGRYKSTWLHRELWLHLMYWLDAEHKIAIMQFVEMVMTSHDIVSQSRKLIKSDTKAKNDAVSLLVDKLKQEHPESNRARHLYSSTQQRLNRSITGQYKALNRDEMTAEELANLDELELKVESFILEHIETTDSREICISLNKFIDDNSIKKELLEPTNHYTKPKGE
ncbi:MAG: KilA-N domain-containing protein [Erysipelotrichia bacterium]|nr:KilA-N domain-containing protein [Erysipelotrichia bacterium]